jgi:tetratricopeptide (TPR) repeat protein
MPLLPRLGLLICLSTVSLAPHASPVAEPEPLPTDALMAIPEALREQLRAQVRPQAMPNRQLEALADFLLDPQGLGLQYRHDATLSVAEAFERREGNCLTFTLMTVALARELGLQAYGQDADAVSWHQQGGSIYRTQHVNAGVRIDGRRFSIDLASNQVITREPPQPISDARLIAHYYSNRAAELLAQGRAHSALAHAQRAVQIDARHAAALSNTGVIRSRMDDPSGAESEYLAALAIEPRHPGALFNLAELYARNGKGSLARDAQERLQRELQRDPFHHFMLGLQREAAGDPQGAIAHLQRAVRLHRHDHRFHFALARAWIALDRGTRAARALQIARDLSEGEQQQRYQAKLDGLRVRPPSGPWLQGRRSS